MPPQPFPGDCRFCGRHFKFLREHIKNMHDGDAGRMDRVPCTVPYCTSRFLNKAALRKHFEKHHRFANKSPSPPPAPLVPLSFLSRQDPQNPPQGPPQEGQSQKELQNPSVNQQQDQPEQQQQLGQHGQHEPKLETQQASSPERHGDPSAEQQPGPSHRSVELQLAESAQPHDGPAQAEPPKLEQPPQEPQIKRSESAQDLQREHQLSPPAPSVDPSGTASTLQAQNSDQTTSNEQGGTEAPSLKVL